MTKVTIDRELLERAALLLKDSLQPPEGCADFDDWTAQGNKVSAELRAILAAPRQPEGEGLEVVGWYHSHAEVATSDKARVVTWLPECIEPLCRLSDAQRAIAELREERERLEPVDTVPKWLHDALIQQAKRVIAELQAKLDDPDYPPKYSRRLIAELRTERDTLRQQLAERDAQIERLRGRLENAWHEGDRLAMQGYELQQAIAQRDKLAGLLYEASGELRTDRHHGLGPRIDAALAEVKSCQESPHPAAT